MIALLILLTRMMLSEGVLNSMYICAFKYRMVHTCVFVCVCICV